MTLGQNPVPPANAVVVVFAMKECPACADYMPRFQAVASQFAGRVGYQILDANAPGVQALAERFNIEATPTTLVLRRPVGAIKAEGSLSDGEILHLFNVASMV
jgi:thiol-disulfide isomerase/thioredoxin